MKMKMNPKKTDPTHAYDCRSCRFNWCCGPTCHCNFSGKLPEPPEAVKQEVDSSLVQIGLAPQFYGIGAQRR